MKITKAKQQDVLSNNKDESMNFDIGDVSVIIEILRNRLYSNPIQTLTQEYLSNGRDATREAGSDTPLKVTLPTGLDSVLKIRDYGVGLSPQRVKEVFVLYGASTKRDNNNQTGGFGIGAKSAWAYTDSFTVVSYYNGVMYTYIAHTGDNANGTFEKMGEDATTEPNGVEIQIPVKNEHRAQFINAVYRSTLFWKVKPNFSGITEAEIPVEYKNFFEQVLHEGQGWKIIKTTDFYKQVLAFGYGHNPQAVMSVDGIPYPLQKFYGEPVVNKLLGSFNYDNFIVIEGKNDEVEVSATREAISDKEHSKKKVVEKFSQISDSLSEYIKSKTEKPQPTFFGYFQQYDSIVKSFSKGFWPEFIYKTADSDVVFKTNNFRALIVPENLYFAPTRFNLRSVRGGKVNLYSEESFVDLNRSHIFFVVRDCEDSQVKTKEKIRALVDAKNLEFKTRDAAVYLLEGFEAEKMDILVKEFQAYKLSSLTYDPVKKEAKKRSTDKINVRYISYEGHHSWSKEYVVRSQEGVTFDKLNENKAKYVIVPFSSDDAYSKDNHEFLMTINFLKTIGGFNVIKLSNRDYRLAQENLDEVYEYAEVIKDLPKYVKLSKEKEDQIKEKLRFNSALNIFSSVAKNLKDLTFKDFIENTTSRPQNAIPDSGIDVAIQKKYEVYTKTREDYDRRVAEEGVFYTRYPILRQLDYRQVNLETLTHIVDFINFLYDKRNNINEEKKKKKS